MRNQPLEISLVKMGEGHIKRGKPSFSETMLEFSDVAVLKSHKSRGVSFLATIMIAWAC